MTKKLFPLPKILKSKKKKPVRKRKGRSVMKALWKHLI
jgi:hypothetical protein